MSDRDKALQSCRTALSGISYMMQRRFWEQAQGDHGKLNDLCFEFLESNNGKASTEEADMCDCTICLLPNQSRLRSVQFDCGHNFHFVCACQLIESEKEQSSICLASCPSCRNGKLYLFESDRILQNFDDLKSDGRDDQQLELWQWYSGILEEHLLSTSKNKNRLKCPCSDNSRMRDHVPGTMLCESCEKEYCLVCSNPRSGLVENHHPLSCGRLHNGLLCCSDLIIVIGFLYRYFQVMHLLERIRSDLPEIRSRIYHERTVLLPAQNYHRQRLAHLIDQEMFFGLDDVASDGSDTDLATSSKPPNLASLIDLLHRLDCSADVQQLRSLQTSATIDNDNSNIPSSAATDSEQAVARISKPCPRCGQDTQKMGGCDHMTCRVCRHEYCWLCLEPYTHAHFGGCLGRPTPENHPDELQPRIRRSMEHFVAPSYRETPLAAAAGQIVAFATRYLRASQCQALPAAEGTAPTAVPSDAEVRSIVQAVARVEVLWSARGVMFEHMSVVQRRLGDHRARATAATGGGVDGGSNALRTDAETASAKGDSMIAAVAEMSAGTAAATATARVAGQSTGTATRNARSCAQTQGATERCVFQRNLRTWEGAAGTVGGGQAVDDAEPCRVTVVVGGEAKSDMQARPRAFHQQTHLVYDEALEFDNVRDFDTDTTTSPQPPNLASLIDLLHRLDCSAGVQQLRSLQTSATIDNDNSNIPSSAAADSEQAVARISKPCPRCGQNTQKTGGCDSMTCHHEYSCIRLQGESAPTPENHPGELKPRIRTYMEHYVVPSYGDTSLAAAAGQIVAFATRYLRASQCQPLSAAEGTKRDAIPSDAEVRSIVQAVARLEDLWSARGVMFERMSVAQRRLGNRPVRVSAAAGGGADGGSRAQRTDAETAIATGDSMIAAATEVLAETAAVHTGASIGTATRNVGGRVRMDGVIEGGIFRRNVRRRMGVAGAVDGGQVADDAETRRVRVSEERRAVVNIIRESAANLVDRPTVGENSRGAGSLAASGDDMAGGAAAVPPQATGSLAVSADSEDWVGGDYDYPLPEGDIEGRLARELLRSINSFERTDRAQRRADEWAAMAMSAAGAGVAADAIQVETVLGKRIRLVLRAMREMRRCELARIYQRIAVHTRPPNDGAGPLDQPRQPGRKDAMLEDVLTGPEATPGLAAFLRSLESNDRGRAATCEKGAAQQAGRTTSEARALPSGDPRPGLQAGSAAGGGEGGGSPPDGWVSRAVAALRDELLLACCETELHPLIALQASARKAFQCLFLPPASSRESDEAMAFASAAGAAEGLCGHRSAASARLVAGDVAQDQGQILAGRGPWLMKEKLGEDAAGGVGDNNSGDDDEVTSVWEGGSEEEEAWQGSDADPAEIGVDL